MCEFLKNPFFREAPLWANQENAFMNDDILKFHRLLEGYEPTPVHSLNGLAKKLGIGSVYVKDESFRFGVKAFKPLGASYTIYRFLKSKWEDSFPSEFTVSDFKNPEKMHQLGAFTFCAATDGNHGRAVAWTARILKQNAVIYMPANTVASRIKNIESEGARVVLIDGTFDECVSHADADAKANGWIIISDTAYPGYMFYPQFIMAGYSTIFHEMDNIVTMPSSCKADIVILQAGVGGLAAAGTWYMTHKYGKNRPKIICLEPTRADAFMESVKNGKPTHSKQDYNSIMAGLNCGVSLLAWDYISQGANYMLTVSDTYAEKAMRQYYHPEENDPQIISGESGASGMAGLLALCEEEKFSALRNELGMNSKTSVLLINSEGDTDPVNFKKVVS
ncbi:MAG TPA: diaminopropionate ammonia-lyase [Bacteroidales bacterium]|nr:diaminopropionate ammonia-lyase [Bacteroidales bacterium]